ncbi:hypothetical protein VP01_4495g1, partial [Puccinia sorghi]
IAGFASHTARFFCSWCKCEKEDMSNMQISQRQTRSETRIQAHKWRESLNLAEQTRLLKMYGARWSSLLGSNNECCLGNHEKLVRRCFTTPLAERKAGKLKANGIHFFQLIYLGDTTASGVTNSNQHQFLIPWLSVLPGLLNLHQNCKASVSITQNPSKSPLCSALGRINEIVGPSFKCIRVCGRKNKWQITRDEFCQIQRFVSQKPTWSLNQNTATQRRQRQPLAKVHPTIYTVMLEKLQFEDPNVEDYQLSHHTAEARVLSPFVKDLQSCESPSGVYIRKSKKNCLVEYQKDGKAKYGWVTHTYSLVELDWPRDGLAVSEGFVSTLGDLQLKVVVNDGDYELLDTGEVTAICAYCHLPAWNFWNSKPLIFLRPIPHVHSPLLCPSSTKVACIIR